MKYIYTFIVATIISFSAYAEDLNEIKQLAATVHQITGYNYQFHGGPNGYQNSRSILRLEENNIAAAYVYFIADGLPIPADTQSSTGFIKMYMPASSHADVIDMLRNESPIFIYHVSGNTRFYTTDEPVGEGEI